ncbi:dioxygenase (plasmid) [Thioclava sp. 'Guangxiensis']|uniref:dioxygenase family protein n=1 Tax=Thioclava sp. 'Guangxiensis' TaxID=3149044 RepID=UPI0032C42394
MATNLNIETVTDIVISAIGQHGEITDRQRELMTALVRHLHDFCRETKLQHDEFLYTCEFLARTGQMCSEKRQEFILLGDILGVEILVDMLSNPTEEGGSDSCILGPFYRENPPVLPKGASTVQMAFEGQETVYFEGHVLDADGKPLEGVLLDVWEDAPNGLYENHDPNQPEYNLRGRFITDEKGHFAFRALRPVPYPIPNDESAGELIRAMGHHPFRPGHIHFMIAKEGYRPFISQVFDSSSDYLEEDSVFAVKQSLIADFKPAPEGIDQDLYVNFDFVLTRAAKETALAAE